MRLVTCTVLHIFRQMINVRMLLEARHNLEMRKTAINTRNSLVNVTWGHLDVGR